MAISGENGSCHICYIILKRCSIPISNYFYMVHHQCKEIDSISLLGCNQDSNPQPPIPRQTLCITESPRWSGKTKMSAWLYCGDLLRQPEVSSGRYESDASVFWRCHGGSSRGSLASIHINVVRPRVEEVFVYQCHWFLPKTVRLYFSLRILKKLYFCDYKWYTKLIIEM